MFLLLYTLPFSLLSDDCCCSEKQCVKCHSCGPGEQAAASAAVCEKCHPGKPRQFYLIFIIVAVVLIVNCVHLSVI